MQRKLVFCLVLLTFIANMALPCGVNAQTIAPYGLPQPQQLLNTSKPYSYPVLKGVKINPDNPAYLEFIIDAKDRGNIDKEELARLVSYFLACLTIPEQDLWVNLSPYEQERITSEKLAQTDLGKDMLGEDYVLKQLASSLTYPESEAGKKYWDEINNPVGARHASPAVTGRACPSPTNTFQKIWIVPDKALIYEHNGTAVIKDSRLKVMMDSDYVAIQRNSVGANDHSPVGQDAINRVSTTGNNIDAFKTHILPLIEKEVNTGENFARLRQIHNAFLLAAWFKKKVKDSAYKYYIDKGKVKGIDLKDTQVKENIYNLYVEAFKKGAYDYVKRDRVGANDYSPVQKISKRRYFSGGIVLEDNAAVKDDPRVASIPVGAGVEIIPQGSLTGAMKAPDVRRVAKGKPMSIEQATQKMYQYLLRKMAEDKREGIEGPMSLEVPEKWGFSKSLIRRVAQKINAMLRGRLFIRESDIFAGWFVSYREWRDPANGGVTGINYYPREAWFLKQSDVPEFGASDESVPEWIYKPWIKKALKQQNGQYLYEVEPVTLNKQQVRRFVIEDTKGTMPVNINAWHYLTRDRKFLIEVVRPELAPEIREHAVNVHEPGEAEQQLIIKDKEKEDKEGVQEFLEMFEQDESRMAHILQSAKERAGQPELIAYDRWQISEIVQNPARLARMLAEDRTLHYDLVEYFMGKSVREQIEAYDKMFYAALKRAARKAGTLGIAEKAAYKLRISNRVQVMPSDLEPFTQKVYLTVLEYAHAMKQQQKSISLNYLNILLAGSFDPGDLVALHSKIYAAIREINGNPLSRFTIPLPYGAGDLFTDEPRPIITRINVNRLKVWGQSKIEGLEGADKLAKKIIADLFGNQLSFSGKHRVDDDFDGIWTLEIAIRRLAAGEDEVVYEEGNQRIVLRNFRRNLAGGFSFNALRQDKLTTSGGSSQSWSYVRSTRVDFIDEAYPLVSVAPRRVIAVPDHIYLSHSRVVSLTMININQFRGGGQGDVVVHQRIYYAIQHLLDNSGPNGDRKPVDLHFNEDRGRLKGQQMLARVYPFTREPATDRLVLRIDWWHMTPEVALGYHKGKLPEPDKSTTAYTMDNLISPRRHFQGAMKASDAPQAEPDKIVLSEREAKILAAKHIGQTQGVPRSFTGMHNESATMFKHGQQVGEPTLWQAIQKLANGYSETVPLMYCEGGYLVELQPLQKSASGQLKVVLYWFPWTGTGFGDGEVTEVDLPEPAKGNSVPGGFQGSQKKIDAAGDGNEEVVELQIANKWVARALQKNDADNYVNPFESIWLDGKEYKKFVIEESDDDPMTASVNAWHELNSTERTFVIVVRRGLPAAIREYLIYVHEPGEAEERLLVEAQALRKERVESFLARKPAAARVTTGRIAHAVQSAVERIGKTELIPYDVAQIKEIVQDGARLGRVLNENRTEQHEWIRYFLGESGLTGAIVYEKMYYKALQDAARTAGWGDIIDAGMADKTTVKPASAITVPDVMPVDKHIAWTLAKEHVRQYRKGDRGAIQPCWFIRDAIIDLAKNSGPNGDNKFRDVQFTENRGILKRRSMLARIYPFTRNSAGGFSLRIDWWHMTSKVVAACKSSGLPEPGWKTTVDIPDRTRATPRVLRGMAKQIDVPQDGGIALTSQTADIRTEGNLNVKMPEQLAREFEASDGAGFRIVFIGNKAQ